MPWSGWLWSRTLAWEYWEEGGNPRDTNPSHLIMWLSVKLTKNTNISQCEEKVNAEMVPVSRVALGAKCTPLCFPSTLLYCHLQQNSDVFSLTHVSAQKIPPTCGSVSIHKRLPAEEKEAENLLGVERDVYFPPSLLCRAVVRVTWERSRRGIPGVKNPEELSW